MLARSGAVDSDNAALPRWPTRTYTRALEKEKRLTEISLSLSSETGGSGRAATRAATAAICSVAAATRAKRSLRHTRSPCFAALFAKETKEGGSPLLLLLGERATARTFPTRKGSFFTSHGRRARDFFPNLKSSGKGRLRVDDKHKRASRGRFSSVGF